MFSAADHIAGRTSYSGFNGLFGDDKAREMTCMAHVRRKFVDVFASQGAAIAEEAICRIADLYAVEKEARGKPPDERVVLRQSKVKPIFDDLEGWLHAQLPRISGKSPLAQAIRYALGLGKVAASRNNSCSNCERFLHQEMPQGQKARTSQLCEFTCYKTSQSQRTAEPVGFAAARTA